MTVCKAWGLPPTPSSPVKHKDGEGRKREREKKKNKEKERGKQTVN